MHFPDYPAAQTQGTWWPERLGFAVEIQLVRLWFPRKLGARTQGLVAAIASRKTGRSGIQPVCGEPSETSPTDSRRTLIANEGLAPSEILRVFAPKMNASRARRSRCLL